MIMTFHEAIGVKVDVDVKTGEKLTHSEIYGRAIELLGGLEVVAKFIPFPLEKLRKAYKSDKHFNNTPMKEWDYAAGFITRRGNCDPHGGGLWHLYRQHHINSASCSNGVCVLKEAARRLVERAELGRTEQEKDKPLMLRLLAVGYPL